MNYHNITKDDMLNGDGLRVVLWVSGCEHRCYGCQNPQTHSLTSGILFDKDFLFGLILVDGLDSLFGARRDTTLLPVAR